MANQNVLEELSGRLSEVIEGASPSIVLVQGRRAPSSGIVWTKELIVTTDHSLPRSEQVYVRSSSGEEILATVAGRDPALDVAILRFSAPLAPIASGLEENLKAGQLALVIGRAQGGRDLSVLCMVSGTGQEYSNWRGGKWDRFIRLDTSPFPGFSGSALVLPNGKIAGMNSGAFSRQFGLTIPASNIERLAQRLSAGGSMGRPYLGIVMQPVQLPEPLQKKSGAEVGLLLMGTEAGGPAEAAGVIVGDILVRLNQKTIDSMEDVRRFLSEESIGKSVSVTLLRGGELKEMQIKVGERPLRQRGE